MYHEEYDVVSAALPKEGTLLGTNIELIPKGAKHPATAHLFLNYLYRTESHLLLTKTIATCPGHIKVGELLPEKVKNFPGVVAPKGYLEKCDLPDIRAVTGKGLELRSKIWEDLKK